MSTGPRRRSDLLAVVFVGGCFGGYVRYAVTSSWTDARLAFPWPTYTVNLVGAFVLGLLVAYVSVARPSRYLRPLVGTGFCGALTTFSSVVVATNELVAHNHVATGVGYLFASAGGGLVTAAVGLAIGRVVWRAHIQREGSG